MRRFAEIALALAVMVGAAAAIVAIGRSEPGLAAVALVGFCLAYGAVLGYRIAPVEEIERILHKR